MWNNQTWWIASWRQIVTGINLETFEELSPMKIMRKVPSDFIYHLIAPQLCKLEYSGMKSEFSRIRDWATDLVLGYSENPPPWVHEIIDEERVTQLKQEFFTCCVTLDSDEGCDWLHQIIRAERNGIAWRDWSLLILDKFNHLNLESVERTDFTARTLIVATTLEDLREAMKDNLQSIVNVSLKTLGWPSPWSPEV
ncbi:TPA: hypothetical protein QCY03_003483 [Bacillus tropicus]|nr:hypothetical protein [Bacillus tropicus]